ncbi:hypothetical protein DXG01_002255 [Tephrocybe rancida]|nr:hypothetical protein DXG01_002255 [Tephrocybe rancida]
MDGQLYTTTAIHVIPPDTPPEFCGDLPQYELGQSEFSQTWPTSVHIDESYMKDRNLSLSIPHPYQNQQVQGSPYLSSPISPSSSTHSLSSPSGLSAVFGEFSIGEGWPGDEPVIGLDGSFSWNPEQDVLAQSSSISSKDRIASTDGLQLTIPVGTLDSFDNFHPNSSSATEEEDFSKIFNDTINFDDASNNAGHDLSDLSPSQSDFSSYASSQHGESSFNISASRSSGMQAYSLLEDASLLSPPPHNVPGLQRRHSSHIGSRRPTNPGTNASSSPLLSPDGHESKHHRRHSHSLGNASNSFMDPSLASSSSSPNLAMHGNNDNTFLKTGDLQRRYSHPNARQGYDGDTDQPLRRHRSSTSIRTRSPYARPHEIEPVEAHPSPISEARFSPRSDTRTPEHSAPPSPLPQSESDMFRRYDNASGIGYPILQRETIASDAVLQASAKRRKKAATYECGTCGQKLTSRDNLNNHLDAHTGIRRHRCDYCHERFRTRSVLKRHQKSLKCPASRQDLKKPQRL